MRLHGTSGHRTSPFSATCSSSPSRRASLSSSSPQTPPSLPSPPSALSRLPHRPLPPVPPPQCCSSTSFVTSSSSALVNGAATTSSSKLRRLGLVLVLVLLLKVACAASASGSQSQRDETPDFFDEYRNDDTNAYLGGEVRRLLQDYKENRDFVQSLENQYYQIIYPVQLLHHGKPQGISTRDASKIAARGQGGIVYQNNHIRRTSYRIKAFSHIFTVDLELNSQLLSPNLMATHRTRDQKGQIDRQLEHCYYHGTVKDYSGAIAAFRTCNGLAGIIQLGNETLIVSPMAGGENLAKHPHFVIEAKNTQIRQKCGYQVNYEWSMWPNQFSKKTNRGRKRKQTRHRFVRDVRSSLKFIETALFLDKKFMENRNYSRSLAINDALQIANIADLYFKTINTRLTVTYLETWAERNMISLDRTQTFPSVLIDFYSFVSDNLDSVIKDTSHLLTGERFQGGESGMGVPNSICTSRAAGISVDLNVYEPHLVASTMAHMIGHNIYMAHDDGHCYCQDWHGCIMSKSVVGQENVQPSKFSKCSVDDYHKALQNPTTHCLLDTPSKFPSNGRTGPPTTTIVEPPTRNAYKCGNGRVDAGEDCDCGKRSECEKNDPCCDPLTCRLKLEAECARGPCCDNCKLRPKGHMCRKKQSECDIPEYCDGLHGNCPADIYKKNGNKCDNDNGYCYNGVCPTLDNQCQLFWGYGGRASDEMCYKNYNTQGAVNGNCGRRKNGSYIMCELGDIMCGTLQCQNGNQHPVTPTTDQSYSRTIVAMSGKEYECKTVSGLGDGVSLPDWTLVRDGTACGEMLICVNQTCVSLYPHIEQGTCRTNNNALQCSGNGDCSNINTCYCKTGWTGDDCSIKDNRPPTHPTTTDPSRITDDPSKPKTTAASKSWGSNNSRNTQYVEHQGSDTVFLVVVLVSGVGSVFFVFAFMALCYRRKSSMPKYDPPYLKRPIVKKPPPTHMQSMIAKTEETPIDNMNRIISFGALPTYSRSMDPCREHKLQSMKRQGPPAGGSQAEEEALHSGVELMAVDQGSYMLGIANHQVA